MVDDGPFVRLDLARQCLTIPQRVARFLLFCLALPQDYICYHQSLRTSAETLREPWLCVGGRLLGVQSPNDIQQACHNVQQSAALHHVSPDNAIVAALGWIEPPILKHTGFLMRRYRHYRTIPTRTRCIPPAWSHVAPLLFSFQGLRPPPPSMRRDPPQQAARVVPTPWLRKCAVQPSRLPSPAS